MKLVTVQLLIDDTEFELSRVAYREEHGKDAPSDIAAIANDLQHFAYDDGGMHGSFMVLEVKDMA